MCLALDQLLVFKIRRWLNISLHIKLYKFFSNLGFRYPKALYICVADALKALTQGWGNLPPSWTSGDPCGNRWEGITCTNSRIIAM